MTNAFSGWDSFTPPAGECKSKKCRVCGAEMEIHPNCQGPRSFASALSVFHGDSKKEDYPFFDHFICPHVDNGWHLQARILLQEAEETPSRVIADVYYTEVKEILSSKKPTQAKFDRLAQIV